MTAAKFFDAVVRIDRVLERLRPIGNACNVCECKGGARDSEGRNAEVGRVGERRIAAIIHDVKATDAVMVIVVS